MNLLVSNFVFESQKKKKLNNNKIWSDLDSMTCNHMPQMPAVIPQKDHEKHCLTTDKPFLQHQNEFKTISKTSSRFQTFLF